MRIAAKGVIPVFMILVVLSCADRRRDILFENGPESGIIELRDEGVAASDVWGLSGQVITFEGNPYGYLRTVDPYENYRLNVEWRWPGEPSNSGIFLHMQEPDQVWPVQYEVQLRDGDAGSFVVFGGAQFNELEEGGRMLNRAMDSSENPPGEWNIAEIECRGDTIQVWVNGVLQNEATGTSLRSGYIGLQSEGGPIEFRNVFIELL